MKRIRKATKSCQLHVWRLKGNGDTSAIKVGCFDCEASFKVYYGGDDLIEMGGVIATRAEWQAVFRLAGIIGD